MQPDKVIIGNAELWWGDCREVLPMLGRVDALVTDPPYGAGYAANPIRGNYGAFGWDNEPFIEMDMVRDYGNIQIIWGGNYYPLPPSRCWLSWFKPDSPPSMADMELAWTNLDKNAKQLSYSIGAGRAERSHVTQKPLKVMAWCLSFAPSAETILDPFMGSGTTGVAAVQAGRKFIGVELDQKYFGIAVERIENAQRQATLFASTRKAVNEQIILAL